MNELTMKRMKKNCVNGDEHLSNRFVHSIQLYAIRKKLMEIYVNPWAQLYDYDQNSSPCLYILRQKKSWTTTELMLVAMADHICHPLLACARIMLFKQLFFQISHKYSK